jgi:uncharacterized protein YcgI (DUF1989 family)
MVFASARVSLKTMNIQLGRCRYDDIIQPVSGRALPLHKGEVLRITQVEGEQCVDFNCFNLHDYKERMSVGHMRVQGIRVREGHIAVSAPPRYRAMLAIIHMAETCVTDLLGARCDATSGELEYGLVPRTNCQDTLAEAIREYGLTPDDAHDSFNMWMHTVWGESFHSVRNIGPKGDYVDLLALMDVLAVPVTCGSGDIGQVSNFGFKPIQVQIFEASEQSNELMAQYLKQCSGFKNQRTRSDFRVREIRADRKLRRVPNYQPQFRAFPIVETEIEVALDRAELAQVRRLRGKMGKTEEEVIRAAFMLWYQANRAKPHWVRPDGLNCSCC